MASHHQIQKSSQTQIIKTLETSDLRYNKPWIPNHGPIKHGVNSSNNGLLESSSRTKSGPLGTTFGVRNGGFFYRRGKGRERGGKGGGRERREGASRANDGGSKRDEAGRLAGGFLQGGDEREERRGREKERERKKLGEKQKGERK